MRIAVRFRYYKAVTPSMEIVDLTDQQWREFLLLEDAVKRHDYMIKFLGEKQINTKELWWIPLDEGMEIKVKKQRTPKENLSMPSKEQIEQFRRDYQAELVRLNDDEESGHPLTQTELRDALDRMSDNTAIYYIQHGIPAKSVAYTEVYYV